VQRQAMVTQRRGPRRGNSLPLGWAEMGSWAGDVQKDLRILSPFLDASHAFMQREGFTTNVVETICGLTSSLYLGVGEAAMAKGELIASKIDIETGPTYSILAAKMCSELQHAGVDQVAEKLQLYCANSNEAIHAISSLKSQLSPKLGSISATLLTQFVNTTGHQLAEHISEAVQRADWFKPNDGMGECLVAGHFMDVLVDTDDRIAQLFPGRRSQKPHWRNLQGKVKSYNFNKAIAKDIDKLFAKKAQCFRPLEFQRDSIMSGIIDKGLKTFTECMRSQTLGTPGLHLIQIDTYVMRLLLRSFTDEDGALDSMLDEAIGSAAERCLAPQPLEASVLENVCEPKLLKLVP